MRGGERLAGACCCVAVQSRVEELGTAGVDEFRLPYLSVDIVDAVVWQKALALEGYIDAIIVGEGTGLHSDPEDDAAGGLFEVEPVRATSTSLESRPAY